VRTVGPGRRGARGGRGGQGRGRVRAGGGAPAEVRPGPARGRGGPARLSAAPDAGAAAARTGRHPRHLLLFRPDRHDHAGGPAGAAGGGDKPHDSNPAAPRPGPGPPRRGHVSRVELPQVPDLPCRGLMPPGAPVRSLAAAAVAPALMPAYALVPQAVSPSGRGFAWVIVYNGCWPVATGAAWQNHPRRGEDRWACCRTGRSSATSKSNPSLKDWCVPERSPTG